jgi:hypothetical protein
MTKHDCKHLACSVDRVDVLVSDIYVTCSECGVRGVVRNVPDWEMQETIENLELLSQEFSWWTRRFEVLTQEAVPC